MKGIRYPTSAEIARARKAGEASRPYRGKAIAYRPSADVVELELFNGLRAIIPRALIDELVAVPKIALRTEMRLSPQGSAIEVRSQDIDISVMGLMRDLVGANIGRVGGQSKSAAKAEAARANGRLGGRPRKVAAESGSEQRRRKRELVAS